VTLFFLYGTGFSPAPEQLLSRNVERFRRGLVLKVHRLLYHSTLGSRVFKKKKSMARAPPLHQSGFRVQGVWCVI